MVILSRFKDFCSRPLLNENVKEGTHILLLVHVNDNAYANLNP